MVRKLLPKHNITSIGKSPCAKMPTKLSVSGFPLPQFGGDLLDFEPFDGRFQAGFDLFAFVKRQIHATFDTLSREHL